MILIETYWRWRDYNKYKLKKLSRQHQRGIEVEGRSYPATAIIYNIFSNYLKCNTSNFNCNNKKKAN